MHRAWLHWRRLLIPALVLAIATGVAGFVWNTPAALQPPDASRSPQPPASGTVTISLIGTNDLHGGVLARDGRGGLATFGGYVNNLRAARARDGGAVLLVDAGDMFQGTLESNLTEGASVVAAYNALGYLAAAVGNHEFDFGPAGPAVVPEHASHDPRGALKARAAEASFPFLAANLRDLSTGRPVEWPNVMPSTIVTVDGIKVGIVGVITRGALTATRIENTQGLEISPLVDAITEYGQLLRKQGAGIVVVAAHAGGRCTSFAEPANLTSCDAGSEIMTAARQLPRGLVDVIVAGHVHDRIAHEVEGIAIVESLSGGQAFGRVDLQFDRATNRVTSKRIHPPTEVCEFEAAEGGCLPAGRRARYEGEPVMPHRAIEATLAPAVEKVRTLAMRPLGVTLETRIRRGRGDESPLGNLFTDAMRAAIPGADAAINNTRGGLRADLPAGPLTYGRLFEVMPFDNLIVQLTITGRELRRVIDTQLRESRRVVGISGFRVRAACSGKALVVRLIRESGREIQDDERVVVVTSDYLAQGGAGIFTPIIPPGGFPPPDLPSLARDEVAAWLVRRGSTIKEADFTDKGNLRWQYPGTLPVRCGST
jgi:2',3'-cyclic-nucleotide 2'-phosphodiesterase (5'-nucleotidase family)